MMLSSSRRTFKSMASQAFKKALAATRGPRLPQAPTSFMVARMMASQAASLRSSSSPPSKEDMFCYQCEQTRHGKGCLGGSDGPGVCGKTSETAALQDLLVHYLTGVSQYAHRARSLAGLSDHEVDILMLDSLFSTMTNVNFDSHRFLDYLKQAELMKGKAKKLYEQALVKSGSTAKVKDLRGPVQLDIHDCQGNLDKLESMGHLVGVQARKGIAPSEDVWSLGELVLYGLKGMAAYADHARILGAEDPKVFAFVHEAMDALADLPNQTVDSMLKLALRTGECNLLVMSLLDKGATDRYGHPVPTEVVTSPVKGKCIAVSGHDLKDLEEVLKRTEGTGINVYTHGELLPAHGYPGLKKYKHLVGNYGGGWQMQKIEFSRWPGPIIMTTNCIIEPMKGYKNRIYTRSVVGWEGVKHLSNWDNFDEIIKQAQSMPGFKEDAPRTVTTTGFARNTVLGIADKVVNAVNTGDVKHFFLVGGCDGAEANRTYFRDVAMNVPKDAVILTLGCGKYRFNKKHFEPTAGGLPRLLDVGQCNDAYSAIQIAVALAGAFKTDVNSLPLSLVISWFEQKAVAVLLTLLHLGIKGIRLGPDLPAFVTPNVLKVLQDNYQLKQVGDYKKDIADMMAGRK